MVLFLLYLIRVVFYPHKYPHSPERDVTIYERDATYKNKRAVAIKTTFPERSPARKKVLQEMNWMKIP